MNRRGTPGWWLCRVAIAAAVIAVAGVVVALTRDGNGATSRRRDAMSEIEVAIGPTGSTLPGTLTLPAGDKPAPAIVLVSGSGPNDRDETVGPLKPFQDLALGLAARGIATWVTSLRSG